jgi:hypothetical protein
MDPLVDDAVADAVEVSQPTVARVRKQFVEQGLEAALNRRAPRRQYQRKIDGAQEARLIALACSTPRMPASSSSTSMPRLNLSNDAGHGTSGRPQKL